jgi:hypothetical protein
MLTLALCLASLSSSTLGASPQEPPTLADADVSAWRDHLAPTEAEERWREIPWRPSMGEGLRDAAQARRPMLLWLMNGHPLGCT